jgi:threonylcarbamoyladenosine tRNA methylthiotransferase MtaB
MRIAFHTFGCKVNQYETLELQSRFASVSVVPFEENADIYLINSCTVTAGADSSCRQLVRKLLRERPNSQVVVTGCYAERAPEELRGISPKVKVFSNREKPEIVETLFKYGARNAEFGRRNILEEQPASALRTPDSARVATKERNRAYIKIQDGCDAHCTYCIVPSVRPLLSSKSPELVICEAENLIKRGFREIVLTGVRLGRYLSATWDLTRLVKALIELPGDFRIRLSSIEITEVEDSLITLMRNNPRLCPHLHVPLQSGDDEILKRMGRWYSAEEFRARLRRIRGTVPDIAITTDVIVGFPGEGESQFLNSRRLLEEEGFSRLHVFRFSARPGTPAEKLSGQIESRMISAFARSLNGLDLALRHRFAGKFIGRTIVLLQESGGGYSQHYVRVRAPGLAEGAFHEVVPVSVSPDASLVVP